jgi:hypothetical protein
MGVAMMTKMDHWGMDESEADQVAASQKLVDWVMLIQALGVAYVPRVIMTKQAMEDKRRNSQHDLAPTA